MKKNKKRQILEPHTNCQETPNEIFLSQTKCDASKENNEEIFTESIQKEANATYDEENELPFDEAEMVDEEIKSPMDKVSTIEEDTDSLTSHPELHHLENWRNKATKVDLILNVEIIAPFEIEKTTILIKSPLKHWNTKI